LKDPELVWVFEFPEDVLVNEVLQMLLFPWHLPVSFPWIEFAPLPHPGTRVDGYLVVDVRHFPELSPCSLSH
jgi:hypothetical protein